MRAAASATRSAPSNVEAGQILDVRVRAVGELRIDSIVVRARETGASMYGFQDLVFYPLKNLILIAIFRLNSWTLSKVTAR